MHASSEKEKHYLEVITEYQTVIAKVCYLHADERTSFEDLYQEVLINIWQGLETFRGEAKLSTWIYRTALNSCLTCHRREKKNKSNISLEALPFDPLETSDPDFVDSYAHLISLISKLEPLEKTLITLWLDETPYEDIASITGLSKNNVAVRIHRVKDKLSRMAKNF